ncbi:MAG: DUF2172 domain-containing protein, partial [Deltaproteobacteria bacterium]|nr:DUF2172 domain-containing protein [Deltaproteobacteria bacterium]
MPRYHYSSQDVSAALRDVGLGRGDVVFCHVGLLKLGFPKEMHQGRSAFEVIHDSLWEILGPDGTLLTPAYSYSFCKGEVFDPDQTPSDVGPFGEAFRKLPGVKRSLDPIFSVAGKGPRVDELFADLPRNCFGSDSIYDRLGRIGAKLVNIGVTTHTRTPLHYIEQVIGVPYRYPKIFSGLIMRNSRPVKEDWIFSVRIMGNFSLPTADKIEQEELELNLARAAGLGLGRIVSIGFNDFYDLCRKKIARDPWFFAREQVDPIDRERNRVGKQEFNLHLLENPEPEQLAACLKCLPRDVVSEGFDTALRVISQVIPLTIHEYPTGTECFGRIIPEKWTCHEASLVASDGRPIFSYADNPRHVASYSQSFEGEISRDELFRHLYTDPAHPGEIPFAFMYYDRDWALCCSQKTKDVLTADRYQVKIRCDFSYGTLKVGEYTLPGRIEDVILICSRLGPDFSGRDDVQSVVAGLDMLRVLKARPDRRYTYRWLVL